jgi:hypothetical protein
MVGPVIDDSAPRKIKLVRIAHVYYTHKDLEKARQFLDDFGFQEVKRVGTDTYYRGTGSEPFVYCARQGDEDEFGGTAFVVESEEDLEYASQMLPSATKIYELSGGGRCVTFRDPVDDFPFHLVYGQTPADDVQALPQLEFNFVCLLPYQDSNFCSYVIANQCLQPQSQQKSTAQEIRPSGFKKVS